MRCFVAVDVDPGAKVRRLLAELVRSRARLRVVPPDNLHFTLKFLGEVAEERVNEIVTAMEAAASTANPFVLTLRGSGAFPRPTSPRVLWIGVEGADPLVAYAQRLEDLLARRGFPREKRPFSPHLTVARVKGQKGRRELLDLLESQRDEAFGEVRVNVVKLKESELRPHGAVYRDVAKVPLG